MKKIVFAISVLIAVIAFGGAASAQADACSTNGGYPPGSPNAVMARMRNIASGAYAACVEAQRARTPPVNWTPTRIRTAARQAVVNKLRDPSSAPFRNVRRIEHSNGSTLFCGEVNGQVPVGSARQPGRLAGARAGPKRKKPHGWGPWGFRRSEPHVRV